MFPKDDRIRLQHLLDAARRAVSFAAGRSRKDLEAEDEPGRGTRAGRWPAVQDGSLHPGLSRRRDPLRRGRRCNGQTLKGIIRNEVEGTAHIMTDQMRSYTGSTVSSAGTT